VLPLAQRIGETEINILDLFLLDEIQHFLDARHGTFLISAND
jgi:hypothetical protein